MIIRPAAEGDIPAVAAIYDALHTEEEKGLRVIGWARGIYPTERTARDALRRGELFVAEEAGRVTAAAVINQRQEEAYRRADWAFPAPDRQVMVLHTLVVAPDCAGRGTGRRMVAFYEEYARSKDCRCLRMDTNARNLSARRLYQSLGFREAGQVPCVFNGIPGVMLVLLEKKL